MGTQKDGPENVKNRLEGEKLPICGLIMPISGTDDPRYPKQHWEEVKEILEKAIREAGFEPKMVSDSDPTAIIQNNIVNNLYYNDITVCDVSSKNPNVMFELGMRLAFDKPVVIVKDDNTDYTFDIGVIQHVNYPCHLDYHQIIRFIKDLSEKIKSTKDNVKNSFLSHFGDINPQHLTSKDIDIKEILISLNSRINNLYSLINNFQKEVQRNGVDIEDVIKDLADKEARKYYNNFIKLQSDKNNVNEYPFSNI